MYLNENKVITKEKKVTKQRNWFVNKRSVSATCRQHIFKYSKQNETRIGEIRGPRRKERSQATRSHHAATIRSGSGGRGGCLVFAGVSSAPAYKVSRQIPSQKQLLAVSLGINVVPRAHPISHPPMACNRKPPPPSDSSSSPVVPPSNSFLTLSLCLFTSVLGCSSYSFSSLIVASSWRSLSYTRCHLSRRKVIPRRGESYELYKESSLHCFYLFSIINVWQSNYELWIKIDLTEYSSDFQYRLTSITTGKFWSSCVYVLSINFLQ